MKSLRRHLVLLVAAAGIAFATQPAEARFLETDPIGYKDQMNLYGYVGNDPLNATDPTGNDARQIVNWATGEVRLVIPVHFVGSGSTPAAVAAIERRVESLNIPNKGFTVDVVVSATAGPGINTMDFSPGLNTALCGAVGECINAMGGNNGHIDSSKATGQDAAAHDILHFAGIIDRYADTYPQGPQGPRVSTPDAGYANNIMGARRGTDLTNDQVEVEPAKNPSTTVCVVYSTIDPSCD